MINDSIVVRTETVTTVIANMPIAKVTIEIMMSIKNIKENMGNEPKIIQNYSVGYYCSFSDAEL